MRSLQVHLNGRCFSAFWKSLATGAQSYGASGIGGGATGSAQRRDT